MNMPEAYLPKVRSLPHLGGLMRLGVAIARVIDMPQEVKHPPQVVVHIAYIHPTKGKTQKPRDTVFTEVDANWVHHPYEDALVVTAKIANNIVHRMLVDNGSIVNTLYWNTY